MAGDITALIVNWSTPDDLERCVRSSMDHEVGLRWLAYQNAHPTVDSTPAMARLFGLHDDFYSIRSLRNDGHGRGINRAAKVAIATLAPKYFFIVNPDVVWTEPVLDRLVEFLEADQNRVVVGPKQLDSSMKITAAGIIGDNVHPKHRSWHVRDRTNALYRDSVEGPTVAGSAFLVRSEDFVEYGGLLEAHHYYSETWFCYHARAHGRECWYYGEP